MSEGRIQWIVGALALLFLFINLAGLTWGSTGEGISRFASLSQSPHFDQSQAVQSNTLEELQPQFGEESPGKESIDAYDDQSMDVHADRSTESDLDSFIKSRLDKVHIPGLSAAIVKDGKIAWTGAYGFALIGKQPVTTDTIFQLASVSKAVVAVAVMKAWEEGEFDLDEDINTYLPFRVRNPHAPDIPITARMLLTHTSTIRDRGDIMNSAYYAWNIDSSVSLDRFLKDYFTLSSDNSNPGRSFYAEDPGTAYHYSNIGASLAAYLVEATTGIPFDTYCECKIFRPLGMEETSWQLADVDHSHLAMPYDYNVLCHHYSAYGFYAYPDYPDGLLKTSAPQLARFLNMFIQYGESDGVRILKKKTVEEIRRVQNPSIDPQGGILWYYKDLSGLRLLGHNGADMGVTTEMFFSPADGVGVILLMNGDCTLSVERAIKEIQIRLFKDAAYK